MTEPVWSDAWLLGVHGKGDPVAAIGAADALKHAIPTHEEWTHASLVLGERGLVQADGPFLRATPMGEEIVRKVSEKKGVSLFRAGEFVLKELHGVPVTATGLAAPDESLLDQAYRDYWKNSRKP